MKGVRKAFSNKLHDGHDSKARDAAKRYWKAQGYLAIDNPNTKGVDLLIMEISFFQEITLKFIHTK